MIKPIKKTGAASLVLLSIISVLIIAGLVFFDWYNFIPNLKLKKEKVRQTQAEIDDVLAKLKKIDKTREISFKINSDINDLELSVPDNEQIPEIVVMFNSLATDSGLSGISQLTVGQVAETAYGYKSLDLDLTIEGSYESVVTFFQNLFTNLRPLKITSIDIAPDEEAEEENTGIISAQVTAQAFFKNSQATEKTPITDPNAAQTPAPATTPPPIQTTP